MAEELSSSQLEHSSKVLEIDPEAHFSSSESHIDGGAPLDTIGGRADPVREISTELLKIGPVISGRGVGTPPGSAVEFGGIVMPNIFVAARLCEKECFAAVSWEAARTVYLNPKIYSSKVFLETFGTWGPILNVMDPPTHTKYRTVMQTGFSPKLLHDYEYQIIKPILKNRFSSLKKKGKADLARELTAYFGYEIAGAIVGFDAEEVSYVATCFSRLHNVNVDSVLAAKASVDLKRYAKRLIDSRRLSPRDDLISAFLRANVDGEPVTEENLIGLIINLMSGGIDTILGQSSIITLLLLENPDQFILLKNDRSLIPAFVDESLRYDGTAGYMARQATQDTHLMGTFIPKDAVVFVLHAVIGRDPTRWEDPHMLNVLREPKSHIQFSAGVHSCIGARVARIALSTFIEHLIDDLPNLRWDGDYARPKITGWAMRKVLSLPAEWDAV